MAEANVELASLKLLAAKRAHDKVVVVNHTLKQRQTLVLTDAVKLVADLVEKGHGQHVLHIVDLKAEKERKLKNPAGSTRRVFNCRTPEQYEEFNAALEPYFEEAVDPQIAIDCIIRALRSVRRNVIRAWVNEGHEAAHSTLPEHLR